MAHRNKRKIKKQKREQREQHEREQENNIVAHSAATLSCAAETAADFAGQCTQDLEDLHLDLPYLRLALEIWREQPQSTTAALLAALEALLSERLRQQQALTQIGQQLEQLAADPSLHIHLDPIERYREWVRNRLFPQQPEATPDPQMS
jgi:hypothetical protein